MFGAYSVLSVRARVLLVVVSVRRFSDKSTLYVGSYTVPCYTVCRILHCTCYEYGSTKYGSVMETWYRYGMVKSICSASSMYIQLVRVVVNPTTST